MELIKKGLAKPRYTADEKTWAVVTVKSRGHSQKEVAQVLGCSDRQIRRWLHQEQIDSGRVAGLKTRERRELFELRRTVIRQEERIQLLEEARIFFATETR